VRVGHFFHLGIAIGMAEALKIETPNIKTGRAQRIAPRKAIEPVGDGEARWKGGAVYIEHGENGARAASRGRRRRQPTQAVANPRVGLRSSNAVLWDPAWAQSSAASGSPQ
jgi:hypothetical protein